MAQTKPRFNFTVYIACDKYNCNYQKNDRMIPTAPPPRDIGVQHVLSHFSPTFLKGSERASWLEQRAAASLGWMKADVKSPLTVSVLSRFSCVRVFVTPWTVALRLLCPWDSPGKNTGVGCHFLL